MSKWIKYLLPLIVVAAFWNSTDNNESTVSEVVPADISIIEYSYQSNFSESESEPCLPRQISFTNGSRVQSAARRSGGQQRNNLEFTKAGRIINTGLRYYIQNKSIIKYSTLTEPSNKLLSLGRLII